MEKNKIISSITIIIAVGFVLGCGNADKIVYNDNNSVKIVQDCHAGEACDKSLQVQTISPQEFDNKINSGEYVLIDIRTPDEHKNERIDAGQMNIDIYEDNFDDKIKELDRNKKYLIYCRSGNRTKMGLNRMRAFGFEEVYDLGGGIKAWKANNLAITSSNL